MEMVGSLCLYGGTLFSDASLLARESTQVVELGTTHLANLVDDDAVDVRA